MLVGDARVETLGWRLWMDRLSRAIARLVTAMIISFGVRPPVIAALELLQRPSVRIVMITRRRLPKYAALFTVGAEPQQVESSLTAIDRARSRTYIPVRTA